MKVPQKRRIKIPSNCSLRRKICLLFQEKTHLIFFHLCIWNVWLSSKYPGTGIITGMPLVRGCLLVHVESHVLCVIFIQFTKFLIMLHRIIHFIVKAELCLTTSCLKLCETFMYDNKTFDIISKCYKKVSILICWQAFYLFQCVP